MNAEDEDYRSMLEELDKEERVKKQVFKAKKTNTSAIDEDGEEGEEGVDDGKWHDMGGGDDDDDEDDEEGACDEDIDQDAYAFVSPVQQVCMVSTLFLTLTHIGSKGGAGPVVEGWRGALGASDQEKLGQLYQVFLQRRSQQQS